MKKIITTLLLLVGASSLSQAQTGKGQTEFGLGVGYGTAYLTADGETSKSIGVLNVAASADFYFSDRWSLKTKVVYDKKGWGNGFIEYVSPSGTQRVTGIDYNYDYITVPVMANWHFGKSRNWYLDFGPYVGFLLSAEAKGQNVNVKPMSNTTDGGLAFGIGVKIPLSEKVKFFIEYDGQSGVANIYKNSASRAQTARGSFNIGLNF